MAESLPTRRRRSSGHRRRPRSSRRRGEWHPFSLVEPETTLRTLGHERSEPAPDTMFFTGFDTSRVHRALSQAPPPPGVDVLVAEGVLQVDPPESPMPTVTPGLEDLAAASMLREIRWVLDFFGGDLGS